MLDRLTHHFPHYFQQRLGRQLEELYAMVGIQDFALAMIILFEPVYLYRLGHSIPQIALYYALVYGLYVVLIPLGGKIVARYGPPRTIMVSTWFLVLYYLAVIAIAQVPVFFWIAPAIFALQKALYWPGYHADFMATSNQVERGKEYSGLYTVTTLMYIIGPAIGGVIVRYFGFNVLFILGAMLIFVSTIPLFVDRAQYAPQTFSYWSSFRLPFTKKHLRTMIAYLGFGEQLLASYIWPIFLAITFVSYAKLGAVVAFATLLSAIVTLAIGRLVDKGQWRAILRVGAWVTVINWLARPFIHHMPLAFTSDTAGRIGGDLTFVTSTEVAYQRAVKENDLLRRAIFLEQGLSYGKLIIALLLALGGSIWSPFPVAFVLGGLFSLLYFVFR